MNKRQTMIEQINAIISFLSESDRKILPEKFVKFFSENAKIEPKELINPNKPLKEQNLSDESILMLMYINKLLNNEEVV